MSKSTVTAIAAVWVLSAALSGCSEPNAPELLAKAKQAMQQNDAKSAQIHLKNALQHDAGLAEARFLLGKLLLEAGDAQGALVEFGKAADAGFPTEQMAELHARALLERRESRKLLDTYAGMTLKDPMAQGRLQLSVGEAHARLGRADEAKAAFERSAALGIAGAEVELARLDAAAGRMDEALARVDALLGKQAKEASAWRLKGDLLAIHKRDGKAARQAYERAAAEAPKQVEMQVALIAHLLSERDLDAAEQQLAKARTEVGPVAGVRYFAAVLDMERGRLEPAFEKVQELLKAAPEDGRVLSLAGQIEYLRNRFLQAESHLTRALASGANTLRVRLMLAQTYLRLEDPARAVQTLQPLLDDQGMRHARVHALAGEALLQLGETRKAEDQFKRAAALDPKDTRSRTLLALGQVGQGQDSRGMSELRELSESFESPLADLALVGTFIRKGDFAGALQAIDGIDRKLPTRGIAPALRAQVYNAQGKPQEAQAALVEALKRDPKYLPAALQLARTDLQEKQPAKAVERIAAVAKADPDNVVTQLAWFNIRLQAGEAPEKVEEELRGLIQKQPQVARARIALARMQIRRGDLAAAASTAQQGVAALPNEAELVELLADVQLRQRETTLAAKTLQKVAELRPRSPEALVRLAEVEASAGRHREALATVRKALALRANHGPALRLQIAYEAELGNVEAARRLVKDMGQLPGLEAQAAAVEGDLESGQQQYGVAASAYRRALSRNAALPEVPARLYRVLQVSGKEQEAQAFARDWFKDHPRDIALMNYLGDAAMSQGKLADARQHYEQSMKVLAEQPLVANNLAWIATQQGDLKRAETLVAEALRLAPGEAAVHDTQAAVHAAAGRHDQAQTAQRRAMQLDANPAYRVGLARRLIAAGRKDAARDELLAVQQLRDRYPGQAEVTQLLTSL